MVVGVVGGEGTFTICVVGRVLVSLVVITDKSLVGVVTVATEYSVNKHLL